MNFEHCYDETYIKYINFLSDGKIKQPEQTYIAEIMPHKLKLNLKYIEEKGLFKDVKIIFRTIGKVVG